jgi:hypothetical protein
MVIEQEEMVEHIILLFKITFWTCNSGSADFHLCLPKCWRWHTLPWHLFVWQRLGRGFDEAEARNFTSKTSSNKYKENHCIQQSINQYISWKSCWCLYEILAYSRKILNDISGTKQIFVLSENRTVFWLRKTEKEFILLQTGGAVEMTLFYVQ